MRAERRRLSTCTGEEDCRHILVVVGTGGLVGCPSHRAEGGLDGAQGSLVSLKHLHGIRWAGRGRVDAWLALSTCLRDGLLACPLAAFTANHPASVTVCCWPCHTGRECHHLGTSWQQRLAKGRGCVLPLPAAEAWQYRQLKPCCRPAHPRGRLDKQGVHLARVDGDGGQVVHIGGGKLDVCRGGGGAAAPGWDPATGGLWRATGSAAPRVPGPDRQDNRMLRGAQEGTQALQSHGPDRWTPATRTQAS